MDDIKRYFEILGVKPGASLTEVKEAYKDLVKVWHPDRYAHDPKLQAKVQEKLKEINGAYQKVQDFLNNPYQYQQATGTNNNDSDETRQSAKSETKQSSDTNKKEDKSSSQPPPFEQSGEKRGVKKSRNIAAWVIGLFIVLVIFKVLTDKKSSPIDDCILKYQKEAKCKQASVIINLACRGNYSGTVTDCILKNIGEAQTDMAAISIRDI